jgi:hypothetical protein
MISALFFHERRDSVDRTTGVVVLTARGALVERTNETGRAAETGRYDWSWGVARYAGWTAAVDCGVFAAACAVQGCAIARNPATRMAPSATT